MRDRSHSISLGWKSIYHFFADLLKKEVPHKTKPQNPSYPIDPASKIDPERGGRPEEDAKADPYEHIYDYMYLYWFI